MLNELLAFLIIGGIFSASFLWSCRRSYEAEIKFAKAACEAHEQDQEDLTMQIQSLQRKLQHANECARYLSEREWKRTR